MHELDENLQHYGVKGMRWGVRRSEKQLAIARKVRDGAVNNAKKKVDRVKARVSSAKRRNDWKKTLKDLDNMSIDDMQKVARRIQLENDFRNLTKPKLSQTLSPQRMNRGVATKKDREDYLKRGRMSDEELTASVLKLRARENLKRTVRDANPMQSKYGRQVTEAAGPLALKYALTRNVSGRDIKNAIGNVNKVKSDNNKELDSLIESLMESRRR